MKRTSLLLALALYGLSVPASAYTEVCTRPATGISVNTQIDVRGKEFDRFVAALHAFAKTKKYYWESYDAPSGRLKVLLLSQDDSPEGIMISNLDDKDLIDANMAECRNDEETPWLPYWRQFMQFVREFEASRPQ
ncbi:MAG TPA: hypothetical protein VHZ78_08150 [Rhizomicrobium sp.]|jgi:hypothetical protein|nr:hypothetical protein [Rhizomicrobium sp.]